MTDQGRAVLAGAQAAAQGYNHGYVGTEHILLALLRTPCAAATILRSFGITEAQVDAKVMELIGMGSATTAPEARLPFAAEGRRVVERSGDEADRLGQDDVDVEHILLALLNEPDGVAARILRETTFTPGPELRRLLMTAAARALDDGREAVMASDILLALTRDTDAAPLLAQLGVDEAAARDAIERVRVPVIQRQVP